LPISNLPFGFQCSPAVTTAGFGDRTLESNFQMRRPACRLKIIRARIYAVADEVRQLIIRNRIAHHEPIFGLDLIASYEAIEEIIGYRCLDTLAWMRRAETVTNFLLVDP
jgi:hypothetical protein